MAPNLDQLNKLTKFGLPGDENLFVREGYIFSYSNRLRQPNWVLEVLDKNELTNDEEQIDRLKCIFMTDPEINPMFSAKNQDYKLSGYQRGHLAAASNHKKSQESVCATFFLSNISPQIGKGFNQSVWLNLENYARNLSRIYKEICIITGPLFLSSIHEDGENYVTYKVIGTSQIAVPTHFFKVILGVKEDGTYEVSSFVIPNTELDENANFKDYFCPLSYIERAAGIVLFEQIPSENIIQVKYADSLSHSHSKRRRRKILK